MSLTTRMLLALVAGLITGIIATPFKDTGGGALIHVVEAVGSVWVNALQMTLIPLVGSLLISVIASAPDARSTGQLGMRAVVVFMVFLCVTGVVSIFIGPALVAMLPIDAATTAALQTGDAGAVVRNAARMPTIAQTLIDIVPANPIRAAADGLRDDRRALCSRRGDHGSARGRRPRPDGVVTLRAVGWKRDAEPYGRINRDEGGCGLAVQPLVMCLSRVLVASTGNQWRGRTYEQTLGRAFPCRHSSAALPGCLPLATPTNGAGAGPTVLVTARARLPSTFVRGWHRRIPVAVERLKDT